MKNQIYFTIFLLFIFQIGIGQNQIHVAESGSDVLGNGSQENPYASIQFASNTANPGDIVYVHKGTYRNTDFNDGDIWEGSNLAKITVNGTAENYIEIKPYPGDHVLLEFDATYGILFSEASYIIFEGFEIKGIADNISQTEAEDNWGIYKDKSTQEIKNLEDELGINYPSPSPYEIGDAISKKSNSNISRPNYYNGRGIVANKSHHIVIRNNMVRDVPSSAIRAQQSDYITITGNEVFNNTFWSTQGVGAITVAEATVTPQDDTYTGAKIILENNYVHHNENRMVSWNPSKEFVTFVIDEGTGLFLTRNNATYEHGYIQISNNISSFNGASGIVCHVTDRAIIEHNTTYKNGTTNHSAAGGIGINNVNDVTIRNNIIYASQDHWALGVLANPVENLTISNNILFNENGSETIHKNLSSGWIEENPQLVNPENDNFSLNKNSVAVNSAGLTSRTLDYFGNKITDGNPDIGAIEYFEITNESVLNRMQRGINLGNTLSAPQEGDWEPAVQNGYFDDVAEAGFSTLRIPMDFFGERTSGNTANYSKEASTASQYSGVPGDYVIQESYLNRVEEVINFSLNKNLVTILDIHGNSLKKEFLQTFSPKDKYVDYYTNPTSAKRTADNEKFRAIWTQLAERFKNYPLDLIFEIINEPYFYLSAAEMDVLNTEIIEIIRNSGGNNATRLIVITGGGENSIHAPLQIGDSVLSSDENLIATFHYYWPRDFTASSGENHNDFMWGTQDDRDGIDANFDLVSTWAKEKNIPVLLGEFGADNTEGFNYSKGEFSAFGGPTNDSRVAFHGFIADLAIEKGFSFTAWDAGHKSNKTIHKRTDDPATVNYNFDGSLDSSTWVEDVKNALLGIPLYPNNDDDNDGIINLNDECPNTPVGETVNEQGCTEISLSTDDIEIEYQNETCASKDNGSIKITSKKDIEFTVSIVSNSQTMEESFSNEFRFENLSANVYNICLSTKEIDDFEQCFIIEIEEPKELLVSSKVNNKKNEISLTLEGSEKYFIELNELKFITSESNISLPLKKGENKIQVTTSIPCQGEYYESIHTDKFIVYPSVFEDELIIEGSKLLSSKIEIFDSLGRKVKCVNIVATNDKLRLNTSQLIQGVYFLKIGNTSKLILKK